MSPIQLKVFTYTGNIRPYIERAGDGPGDGGHHLTWRIEWERLPREIGTEAPARLMAISEIKEEEKPVTDFHPEITHSLRQLHLRAVAMIKTCWARVLGWE